MHSRKKYLGRQLGQALLETTLAMTLLALFVIATATAIYLLNLQSTLRYAVFFEARHHSIHSSPVTPITNSILLELLATQPHIEITATENPPALQLRSKYRCPRADFLGVGCDAQLETSMEYRKW